MLVGESYTLQKMLAMMPHEVKTLMAKVLFFRFASCAFCLSRVHAEALFASTLA